MLKQCKVCGKLKDMNSRATTCPGCISAGYKWCSTCSTVRATDYFRQSGAYLHSKCRYCEAAHQAAFRQSDKGKQYQALYRQTPNGREVTQRGKQRYLRTEKAKAANKRGHAKFYSTEHGKQLYANLRHVRRGAPGTVTADEWQRIQEKFNFSCAYCGSTKKLTQDHVVPVSQEGANTAINLVPACSRCNSSKGATDMSTWYTAQSFFNTDRYRKILQHIGGETADVCSTTTI